MLRDFKFLRRNSSKKDEIENVPVNPDGEPSFRSCDLSIRPPLNAIQDPAPSPKPEADASFRTRIDKTPSKPKARQADHALPRKTPDKNAMHSKYRFGWSAKNDPSDDFRSEMRAGAPVSLTPGVSRGVGRTYSGYSESVSTQSTPTKSVSKPPPSGFRSRIDGNGAARGANFSALYKGIPNSSSAAPVVNTVEVPHFDLKEDPSFWLDHSVQVIIRVRPLNSMEKSTQGYNRCLKQESGQSITWVGHQEARFTFDHVACETVDQEMLFRMAVLPMVENCLAGYNSCLFAYGQTGSGKTYTMLGETEELEFRPSPHRGMTPRIFEFLFARIQAEEESRRDEHLKYSCKCSFLEIYNEQITDLLDPSSTNLQLREDVKAGVYVENLSEFEVQTVSDVLKLLAQGSLNRKVAATNMNRESSRSHCVFTCVIESHWEKDSTTNLRFARLNLVDLAGSERQKTSGAEGERLKEAASINRSLSTLGHVIMILVDVANGRLRHVPYRDSKLTFLLQDSLGGNSKTMIIANVSPSICCAAETLNTLKFAQRARLIQNNAVINEDSNGDVIALKRQIQILKEELAALKRQSVSRCLAFGSSSIDSAEEDASDCINYDMSQKHVDKSLSKGIVTMSTKQLESLEAILAGSLRREQMAEMSMKKLDAEIEQLNHLVRQREEETRSTKMMLRFREEKIQRMESLIRGSLSAEAYLLGENKMLSEECHLLQSKLDKNPEVTRFALENIRLSDQLKRYQEFYEEGEREILKDEISRLRDQLVHFNDGNSDPIGYSTSIQSQDTQSFDKEDGSLQSELERTLTELEECKCKLDICLQENAKLNQDMSDLQSTFKVLESRPDDQNLHINSKKDLTLGYNLERTDSIRIMKTDEEIMDLQLELDITKIILQEERSLHAKTEEEGNALSRDLELVKDKLLIMSRQYEHANNALKEAKSVIEVLESQQILLINEIEGLKKSNSHHITVKDQPQAEHCRSEKSTLEVNLLRMNESLEKAKQINRWYQTSHVLQSSNKEEVQKICRQAEAETAEVIVCMQEELATLQQQIQEGQFREIEAKKDAEVLEMKMEELDNRVFLLTEANEALLAKLEEKDSELMKLSEEWELLASEVEGILANGHDELINASSELDFISSSFPERRIWICEQVGRMMKIISEKDVLINELGRYLEDANKKKVEMESKLTSLRGAAFAMNEAQEHAHSENERKILKLKSLLSEKTLTINRLKDKLREAEHLIKKTSTCATAAFLVMNNFSENNLKHLSELTSKDVQLNESANKILRMDALLKDQASLIEEDEKQVCFLTHELEKEKQTCAMLEKRLSEEQQHADTVRRELEDSEMNELLKTQEKLGELRSNLFMLRLYMSTYVEHEQHPKFGKKESDGISFIGTLEGLSSNETDQQDLQFHFLESIKSGKDRPYGDLTHNLLREELEFALNLLKEVKGDITKIFNTRKEDKCTSRDQSAANMKDLTTLVFALQEAMSGFEKRVEAQVDAINHRLEAFELTVQAARTQYYQTKEYLESEVGDAKVSAAQKAAQASHVLAKFEDAQSMMKEADAMIKGLTIANESLKLDVERLKQAEVTLVTERDGLVKRVGNLESTNFLKDVQLERLEEQFGSDLAETRDLVTGLEDCIAQMQADVEGNLLCTMSDCLCIRPAILETSKLISTWLEDIWSAIIGKDSAVSALYLCHMRTLLETVSGMNVENSFLQRGLGQSNTVIASLKEQNSKSKRELETCIVLKGKLLVDIKNCFDKILQKEEEAEVLTGKLAVFEKRISDLQAQEEIMLQRSNYMGSELALLMKEVDFSNSNFIVSLLKQEEIMKENTDRLSSHFDKSCIDSWEKEIESLVFGLTLEEKLTLADTVIDKLKEELIVSKAEATIQEQLLVDQGIESTLLHEEIDRTRGELRELQVVNGQLFQDLGRMTAEYESSQSCATAANIENRRLQERVFTLENSHFDKSCVDSWEKEIESLVLGLTLEEKLALADTVNDKLKEELIVSKAEATIQEQLLVDQGIESTLLHEEIDRTRGELRELQVVNGQLFQDLGRMTAEYESSQSCATAANIEKRRLQERVFTLENSHFDKSCVDSWEKEIESLVLGLTLEEKLALADTVNDKLKEELIVSKAEATIQEQLLVDQGIESTLLHEETDRTRGELRELQVVNGQLFQDLGRMTAEYESSQSCATAANIENRRLQERVFTLENSHFDKSCVDSWEKEIESLVLGLTLEEKLALADTVNDKLKEELIVSKAEATIQQQLLVDQGIESTLLLEEISRTRGELRELQVVNGQLFQDLGRMTTEYESSQSCATAANIENRRLQERVFTLENSFSCIQNDLEAKNNESSKLQHFQAELLRKDEVLKGLLFDLNLLQESASNTKDRKDEMAEMVTSLEELEEDLVAKSNELDEAISYVQKLENELQEKMDIILNLQSDISKERDARKLVMCENHDLRANIKDVVSAKGYFEEELRKSEEMAGNLETERSQLAYALGKMNDMIESLTANLSELAGEKEQLQQEVLNLQQQLEEQKTVARKNEAIAAEAEHMAESKAKYAEDKEAEVRLLEKSIEELECTIHLLESNVEIIKGEAERQRLQREELELELVALKDQMQNAKRTDSDWKRDLNEKEKELEEALERIQTLEKKMTNKDAEIARCKDHISELNLHAEAQASEYKLKFKELQVMVKQVKPETHTINAVNHSSSNSEKNAMKSRGSGSPFKCIGLGLAQQIKSEKDEDLTAARLRIEELESLAVSRQKEIFALNTRLASAESMTHDVIRDLLGVKLDVTNYASLLNNQQVLQIADKAVLDNIEPHVKEQELLKLKQQLNDFIEERQGWLDEIDRRQAELIAAQIALEKLRQHYQLLKTENEMVKMENVKFKKQVTELEGQVNKLSGQQNLHQRIHHHAKIKEENNILKLQNEELGDKLKRAETMLSRIKEELAHYRASIGRGAFINFDEDWRLNVKLKEVEDDRVQLAQQLLRLCTSVLKAAGITKPKVSDISPDAAEKALEQIKSNFHSMEREMQNLAHKNKVANEQIRLMDLVPQSSPTSQRIEVNCRSPRRASPARFLSAFDR